MSNFQRIGAIYPTLAEACAVVGIAVPRALKGRYTAIQAEDDRRGKAAGRVYQFPDGRGCAVMNWKTGVMAVVVYGWIPGQHIDRRELARLKAEAERARAAEWAREQACRKKAAAVARSIVEASRPYLGDDVHGYLKLKQIAFAAPSLLEIGKEKAQALIAAGGIDSPPQGLRQLKSARLLVAPLVTKQGVSSVQLIDEYGTKTFLRGASVRGAVWCPHEKPVCPQVIGIAEGVATALSVTRLYGVPCMAAMSAGNLSAAARTVCALFPSSLLAFYADRDPSGIGSDKAQAAWLELGADRRSGSPMTPGIYIPRFNAGDYETFKQIKKSAGAVPTDFNDLLALQAHNGVITP